jgi:hypothetical protein
MHTSILRQPVADYQLGQLGLDYGPPRLRGPQGLGALKLGVPKVCWLIGPKGLVPTKLGNPQGPQGLVAPMGWGPLWVGSPMGWGHPRVSGPHRLGAAKGFIARFRD